MAHAIRVLASEVLVGCTLVAAWCGGGGGGASSVADDGGGAAAAHTSVSKSKECFADTLAGVTETALFAISAGSAATSTCNSCCCGRRFW